MYWCVGVWLLWGWVSWWIGGLVYVEMWRVRVLVVQRGFFLVFFFFFFFFVCGVLVCCSMCVVQWCCIRVSFRVLVC